MFSFFISSITSSYIFFSVSCLSKLYSFSFCVISFASLLSSVKKSSNASICFPILPEAFILGAIPNDIADEFISLLPDAIINSLSPMFLVCFINFNPSVAIVLFSSTNGTMSDIVPRHTKSKYFKYSFASSSSFIEIACISLNTTPTPAKPLNGYVSFFLFGSTIQYALGKISACS